MYGLSRLDGRLVSLQKLVPTHAESLRQVASDPIIWRHMPMEAWRADVFNDWLHLAFQAQLEDQSCVFSIVDQLTGRLVGSTRFQDIDIKHRKVDIGWTWFAVEAWQKGHNTETKYLMLQYAFEVWGVHRVGFKVDERNLRSQRAIERIGATQEGLFRNHMIRPDGSHRNTIFYSITDTDWSEYVRFNFENTLLCQPQPERQQHSNHSTILSF
jgi:N-acetyltransferase